MTRDSNCDMLSRARQRGAKHTIHTRPSIETSEYIEVIVVDDGDMPVAS
jgi:hypothetical protein